MWEMCSIDFEDLDPGVVGFIKALTPFVKERGQFVATATGPQGTKIVGKSRIFGWSDEVWRNKTTEACLNELAAELLGDGWIPMGGEGTTVWSWYKLKFRRPI